MCVLQRLIVSILWFTCFLSLFFMFENNKSKRRRVLYLVFGALSSVFYFWQHNIIDARIELIIESIFKFWDSPINFIFSILFFVYLCGIFLWLSMCIAKISNFDYLDKNWDKWKPRRKYLIILRWLTPLWFVAFIVNLILIEKSKRYLLLTHIKGSKLV